MKLITSISRVLVGLLFIFSGIIKSNDPKGTGIKLNEYFDVFASSMQSAQDTLKISVSDDLGTVEYFDNTFISSDSFANIEINQSAPRKEYFEGDQDSTYGCEVFVLKNSAVLFNAFYELGDSIDPVNFSVKLRNGICAENKASSKALSEQWNLTLSAKSKHELSKRVATHPYVQQDSFWVGVFRGMKPYSLLLSVIMCILEVVLGFAILIGWQPKLMSWSILLMVLFFTFLTWYSAYFNKVTDCGCFGDFIKLKPWHSFIKDLVLLFFILIIFIRKDKLIPLFSPLFSINAMIVVTLSSTVFAIYCNMFLPAWDFLPYKAGNNVRQMMEVPKGQRVTDSTVMVYVYKKDNKTDSFVYPNMPDSSWTYVDRLDRIIVPAWKSKIHDFEFIKRDENDINIKDTLLDGKGYYLLLVVTHLEKSHESSWDNIKSMAIEAKKAGIPVYAVTSSPLEMADAFSNEKQLPFKFNNADETLLKTIVRSNPGVMFWHDGTVLDKWSCRSIPSMKALKNLMK
jgi:uncharacterized membrane protein YphA (DoxX/SURF4 family)